MADNKSQRTAGLLKEKTPSMVDEVVNNQYNWNAIDNVVNYIIYCIPKSQNQDEETKESESSHKTMATPEPKETIVKMSIKKGQQWIG